MRDHATYALILAALATAGIILLAALGDTIPDVLSELAIGGLAGGTGLAIPASRAPAPTRAASPRKGR